MYLTRNQAEVRAYRGLESRPLRRKASSGKVCSESDVMLHELAIRSFQ